MARHKLTDSKIKALSEPGIFADGDGLYLRVRPGSKAWKFIWKRYGIRREIGLGPYGSGAGCVSLAAARAKAEEARNIVGAGGDPKTDMAERKPTAPTFGQVADEYIDTMQVKWRGAKTLPRWQRFANTYAKPIRKIPVDKVTVDDVLRVLRPLWNDKPETATKVRESLKLVLDNAKARGLRTGDNPADKGILNQLLPAHGPLAAGNHPAMPFADVPAFLKRLRSVDGNGALALEFVILTAGRSGEVRGATWDEIDLDAALWTIPASRMKSAKVHRVPLSPRAVEIVRQMKETAVNAFVFPGRKDDRPLSDMTLLKALKTAGAGEYTVHGFRSSFRTWVAEQTNFQRELAEQALAHAVGDSVERAYQRGDALDKRRKLMQAWATYLTTEKGGNVVPLAVAP